MLSLGFVRHFPLAVAVLMATGCAQIVFTSSVNTTIQLAVPDAMRGRMMSLYVLVFVGVTPFGAFLTGWLAEHFGVALACVVNGAAGLVTVAALSYLRQRPATTEHASA